MPIELYGGHCFCHDGYRRAEMSEAIIDLIANLPEIKSRKTAQDICNELRGRGFAIVRANEVHGTWDATPATVGELAEARRHRQPVREEARFDP
jgi:hypothetical protein